MKTIAITAIVTSALLFAANSFIKDNDVLKEMECSSKVMTSSPSIVTICELDGNFKRFITPANKGE